MFSLESLTKKRRIQKAQGLQRATLCKIASRPALKNENAKRGEYRTAKIRYFEDLWKDLRSGGSLGEATRE